MSIRSSYVPVGIKKAGCEKSGTFMKVPVPFVPESHRSETPDAKQEQVEVVVGTTKVRVARYCGRRHEDFLRMLMKHTSYLGGARYIEATTKCKEQIARLKSITRIQDQEKELAKARRRR